MVESLPTPLNRADAWIEGIHPPVVHVLGPSLSFSDEMASILYGPKDDRASGIKRPEIHLHDGFYRVLEQAFHNISSVAIVPVENTESSPVGPVREALVSGRYTVLGEGWFTIDLMLAGKARLLRSVRKIYSQPKAFEQSRKLLNSRSYELIEMGSTSEAAEKVANLGASAAALCGRAVAARFKLDIIKESVQDNPDNKTRFLVVQSTKHRPKGRRADNIDDLSVLTTAPLKKYDRAKVAGIVLPTKPAAENGFRRAMNYLGDRGLSEDWLEKRNQQTPPSGGDRSYFVEFSANPETLFNVLHDPRTYHEYMRFIPLGAYPVGSVYSPYKES